MARTKELILPRVARFQQKYLAELHLQNHKKKDKPLKTTSQSFQALELAFSSFSQPLQFLFSYDYLL